MEVYLVDILKSARHRPGDFIGPDRKLYVESMHSRDGRRCMSVIERTDPTETESDVILFAKSRRRITKQIWGRKSVRQAKQKEKQIRRISRASKR